MTHPEPLQQAAQEMTEKHGCTWAYFSGKVRRLIYEALLTEPKPEWRETMTTISAQEMRDRLIAKITPTEQPEPSEDYRRRACAMLLSDDAGEQVARLLQRLDAVEARALHIVFDGPPGPEAGRFVEVETPDGRSLNAGEWRKRSDDYWELVIPGHATPEDTDLLLAREAAAQEWTGIPVVAEHLRAGRKDDTIAVRAALRALKLKEQGK